MAADEGFLLGKCYLLMDRDAKFSKAFRAVLSNAGVRAVRLPPQSPNLNAHLERFWRSLREQCLDRMIFFGEDMLRRVVHAYIGHYHRERNHQGLENRLIEAGEEVGRNLGDVHCQEHLGGLLRYYYRQAAQCLPFFVSVTTTPRRWSKVVPPLECQAPHQTTGSRWC